MRLAAAPASRFVTREAWNWQNHRDIERKAHKYEQANRMVGRLVESWGPIHAENQSPNHLKTCLKGVMKATSRTGFLPPICAHLHPLSAWDGPGQRSRLCGSGWSRADKREMVGIQGASRDCGRLTPASPLTAEGDRDSQSLGFV